MKEDRYIRQTLLDQIGQEGQEKLLNTHVAIVGCGGLGSIAAPYLAGAGVGKLTLIDGDSPEVSNLHRQVFFATEDTGYGKSMMLAQHIQKLNPTIDINVVSSMITKANIDQYLSEVDLVLECTDHIQTKYLVNDYCHLNQLPLVYGAIHKYDGYASLFENKNEDSIHLRDIFPDPNNDIPTCSEVGVMGTIAGMIGLLQANEAIKAIVGAGQTLVGQMLTYNILSNDQMKLKLKKTYTKDLIKIYEQSTYTTMQTCAKHEITFETLRRNREAYHVISILDKADHEAVDSEVEHKLQRRINPAHWEDQEGKTTVFYCKIGRRSGMLVHAITAHHPDARVLSLAGGLKQFQKERQ